MTEQPNDLEADPRFPSGKWTGFWVQPRVPGKQFMELQLTFRQGTLTGEGRDRVGLFTFNGSYNVEDGKCSWTKHYTGRHNVLYKGYNEGKGIWGVWEMAPELAPASHRGGFHIWPRGMADPSAPTMTAASETPVDARVEELAGVPG
jgi:hypothetical protein